MDIQIIFILLDRKVIRQTDKNTKIVTFYTRCEIENAEAVEKAELRLLRDLQQMGITKILDVKVENMKEKVAHIGGLPTLNKEMFKNCV